MGTKNEPGAYDCYANALADEPLFVLLARDPDAPALLELWAAMREVRVNEGRSPRSDLFMLNEARRCAENRRQWRHDNGGRWRKATAT